MDEALPQEIITVLDGEMKDFAVKSQREVPPSTAWGTIITGLLLTGFISIFWFVFFGPVVQGKVVHFTSNGQPVSAGPGHLQELTFPGIIISIFTVAGFVLIGIGIRMLFASGAWFVGTPTRLIVWRKKLFRSIDWKDFSGTIDVAEKNQEGTLTIEMKAGHMVSHKNGPDEFVPDKLYIVGIPNAVFIEESCRKRIKENESQRSS